MKNSRGITLVALIITVVIMLILAGVAIGTVTGDGLFSKTRDAVGVYENATRTESEQIQTLMNEINNYLTGGNGGEKTDTTPPTTATIESSNITTTTATLTATGEDGETGIGKYEFYVDGTLYNTVTTSETSTSITLTFSGSSHSCMIKVYDMAGNYKDSNTITVTKHVHTDTCYNWITITGDNIVTSKKYNPEGTPSYYRTEYKCNRCGRTGYSTSPQYFFNYDVGDKCGKHTSTNKGSLKCTL